MSSTTSRRSKRKANNTAVIDDGVLTEPSGKRVRGTSDVHPLSQDLMDEVDIDTMIPFSPLSDAPQSDDPEDDTNIIIRRMNVSMVSNSVHQNAALPASPTPVSSTSGLPLPSGPPIPQAVLLNTALPAAPTPVSSTPGLPLPAGPPFPQSVLLNTDVPAVPTSVSSTPGIPLPAGLPIPQASRTHAVVPLDDFVKVDKLSLWAGRDATGYFTRALPDHDAWDQVKIQDPYLRENGLYKGVPNLPRLELHSWDSNETEVDQDGNPVLHGLNMEMLEPLGIPNTTLMRWLTFVKAGFNANPSRANPLDFRAHMLSPENSTSDFIIHDTSSKKIAIFWTLGVVERSYIAHGRVSSGGTRVPSFRGVTAIPHRWEFERMCAFFATVFQNRSIIAQFDSKRAIAFQTRFQKNGDSDNASATASTSHAPPSPGQPLNLGKIVVGSYGSPVTVKESYFKNGFAFNAKIPVYDGRNANFDPNSLPDCLNGLSRWTGDIPAGAYVFVGYASYLQFHKQWKSTFYVRHIVILGF